MAVAAGFITGAFGFAAPGLAGSAMLGGWIAGASFASTALGSLTVKLLTSVAVSALQRALSSQEGSTGGIKISTTTTGEDTAESIMLGWYATAGHAICPPMSHGKNHRYLTHVIELCSAPGATLDRLMIGDNYVNLSTTAGEYGHMVSSGEHGGLIWVKYYDGTQTAADPMLLDKYGGHPDRPWKSDMIGNGICYAILTFLRDNDRMTSVPKYLFEMTGIPLYDPRKDDTVGGTGTHRIADPATWEQTVNPIVISYNTMRGIELPGGDVWGGNVDLADLPLDVWFAGMNACDAPVDLSGGGTEPAWRAGFEAGLDIEPAAVLEDILRACSGDVADIAGTWKVRVGGPGLPVHIFTDDDIIRSKPEDLDPFPALERTYNGITATYPDPEALWQSKDAPGRYNAEWEAADVFGRRTVDLKLSAAPYPNQVQRGMKGYIEDQRRFLVHKNTMTPAAAALEPLDVVAWDSTRNGYDGKTFEITTTIDDLMTCCQGETLKEVDPNDWSWSSDLELPTVPSSPGYTRPDPDTLDGFDLQATTIKDADGIDRRPALKLIWDADVIADGVQWEIKLLDDPTIRAGSTQAVSAGEAVVADGILGSTTYAARSRPIVTGWGGTWSDWKIATTGAVQISALDLAAEITDTLTQAAADAQKAIDDAAAAQGAHDALVAGFAGTLAAAFDDVDANISTVNTSLTSEINGVYSLLSTDYYTIAQTDSAISNLQTTLQASIGINSGSITDIMGLAVDGGTAFGALLTQLEVDAGGHSAWVDLQASAMADLEGFSSAFAGLTVQTDGGNIAGLYATSYSNPDGSGGSALKLLGDNVMVPGSLSASSLTITDMSGNLIPDPSFSKLSMLGWNGTGIVAGDFYPISRDDIQTSHPTVYANAPAATMLRVDEHIGEGNRYIRYDAGHIQLTGEEQVSISYKAASSGWRRHILYIQFYAADGTDLGYVGQFVDGAPATWTPISGTFNVPDGAAIGMILLSSYDDGNQSGELFVCDLEIIKARDGAVSIKGGTVTAELVNTQSFGVAGLSLFGGDLKSTDYEQNVSGWIIRQDGSAEFKDIAVRSWFKNGQLLGSGWPIDIEVITASTASFNFKHKGTVKIYVLGAGGSGAQVNGVAGGSVTGIACGGLGGGLAVKYMVVDDDNLGPYVATVGSGGAAFTAISGQNRNGNNGSLSSLVGLGLNIVANGGDGGRYAYSSGTAVMVARDGGTASGGDLNITGGGNKALSTASDGAFLAGGAAPDFGLTGAAPDCPNYSKATITSGWVGGKSVPNAILELVANPVPFLGFNGADFVAGASVYRDSNGVVNTGNTASGSYGCGSGATACNYSSLTVAAGGNGLIAIVYYGENDLVD